MAQPDGPEFRSGRIFLHRLASGEDPSSVMADFCIEKGIQTATFTLSGVLSTVTLGIYDLQQQVYITRTEETDMEILSCAGNISIKNEAPCICATIALADKTGRILGGRLFSPSRSFAVEMALQELTGFPLQRTYDAGSGLDLWPLHRSQHPLNT